MAGRTEAGSKKTFQNVNKLPSLTTPPSPLPAPPPPGRENPNIYFVSVSPGGTATGFYTGFPQPLKCLVSNFSLLFRCVGVFHSLDAAADRFLAAATDPTFEEKYKTGSLVASPYKFPWYWGATGPLTDNTEYCPELKDRDLEDKIAKFIRYYTKKAIEIGEKEKLEGKVFIVTS